MSNSKFTKPPLTNTEKEKRLEAFLNLADTASAKAEKKKLEKPKKEKTKPLFLRAPESLWEDIHEIMVRTGLSMNATCLALLQPEIKKKLKELRED